ncbi:cbb3-type cytochrome c oxidase subunit 3 [Yoonia sp. 208BN28-4]|uniref:cbb3-type cytochrome c oxidase subunit 3 n=1 Tax=Yoonia sp. 208BN28-4 TaxID=3126505 RepID=UPI0030B594F4
METYTLLREIADSWVLLAMFMFFLGVGVWAFLPSQARNREDASLIPFRNDNPKAKCSGTCASCKCADDALNFKEPRNV